MLDTTALSAEALASVLNQSVDCVKLVGLDGSVKWMNFNGLCAMEIDDFCRVKGQQWSDLWPSEARQVILAALSSALSGETVRFDAFCPTAKGKRRWWNVTVSLGTDVDGNKAGFLAISRDITEVETNRQALEIAAIELRHRLKNTYAIIGSLMTGFARGTPDREVFAREMMGRLISLSAAQSLFSTQDAPCEIATLIPALVSPFESPACAVTIDPLPPTLVSQGRADAVALVFGELAVNSAKHGAVSAGGSLHISAADADGTLRIVWTERSARPVEARNRDGGQGLQLIERIVRAREGVLTIDWQDHGLTVTLAFSL